MRKYVNKQTAIILAVAVSGVLFFSFLKSDSRNFQLAKNIDIFNSVVKELELFYVDTIEPDKVIRMGIDAMLMSLDPYTNYFPRENQTEIEQMVKGSYGGIGSLTSYNRKRKRSVIAEPFEGMPAHVAGMKSGDIILAIDGEDTKGKTHTEVIDKLRGQVNTSLQVKVERPGATQPLEFTIVRKSIQLPTVPYHGMVSDSIGYINLNSFSGDPSKEFKAAFLDLKKNTELKSLVIDLRGNGGGLLEEAIDIVNYFVPRGEVIVTTKGKTKQAFGTYKTRREPIDTEIPIVVLVNSGTASSSEILAGALQDLDRAVIVGNRTFGKGLVQVTRPLPYNGTLKVTTSRYFIPSGRSVQAINYKNRNEDGSVGRIPDSLTTAYRTLAGREVRDGGGISPDVAVEQERFPNILFYLINDDLTFDYATQYVLKHSEISDPSTFELTEADYEEFKEMVRKADFKYDQQSEKILETLKEIAEFEGYMEEASAEFEALGKKLSHNLDRDLDYFSKDIKSMLCNEIVKRYYFQRGSIIQQLKDDSDLKEAIRILSDPAGYAGILATPAGKGEDVQPV